MSLVPLWLFPGWTLPSNDLLSPTLSIQDFLKYRGDSCPQAQMWIREVLPTSLAHPESLLAHTCHLSIRPGLHPAHSGAVGTYFPEAIMSLKASSVLLKAPVLTYVRDSPASILLPLPPLGPRIFVPPHFCLKAFSLCEGLSTAFLSNSSQRGGRFICEPEQHGTVAGGGCEKATMGLRLTSPLPPPPPTPPSTRPVPRKVGSVTRPCRTAATW